MGTDLGRISQEMSANLRAAYCRGDWKVLGYPTWDAYAVAEFGAEWLDVAQAAARVASPDKRSVYFVQALDGGPIKIGVAANPTTRLVGLQTGSPVSLRLLATVDAGGARLEHQLHAHFAASRSHGEWFRPTPELLTYIEDVTLRGSRMVAS